MTVITHSSIAILLIWLMKPNVFELRAPISKVAMLGCYHDVVNLRKSQNMLHDSDHTQQHCYFADMAYETKCV
jgi:hypothetical protein